MPVLTRRAVLGLGVAAGSLALTQPVQAATVRTGHPRLAGTIPSRAVFSRALGTTLTATSGLASYRLRLVDILDLCRGSAGDPQLCFNLILRATRLGESFAAPAEGNYRLSSFRIPSTILLLSPIGSLTGPQELQAVVNRPF